tara:strand:- start:479 stop:637 length:159 start_codon:yes stop_codon:yes gene_type:complete
MIADHLFSILTQEDFVTWEKEYNRIAKRFVVSDFEKRYVFIYEISQSRSKYF